VDIVRAEPGSRIGALDGLRAFAVSAVVIYHLAPSRLPSGSLGVDVFMVVSGFIVTALLMREYERNGRVRVGAFWGRRFRRLVPAVMALVVVVTTWVHLTGPATLIPPVRSEGVSALAYVTNWKLIAGGVSYGGALASNSPFVHLWSLAVEEQFYLVWPLLLIGLLGLSRGRRWLLVALTATAGMGSAVWMAHLYDPARNPLRLYYGTDTRAQAFLFGAVAAMVAPHLRSRGRRAVSVCGPIALVALIVAMTTNSPGLLYRGGFALVAVAAALAACATTVPGIVQVALDRPPLRGLGRVSYGVYLWHWPAITLLTTARIGIGGVALTALRLAVTAAGTASSWVLLERPLARARPPRVALTGGFAVASAASALVLLPAGQAFAYANLRTDRIPKPVVAAPLIAARRPTAAATAPAPTTTAAPRAADPALVLPRYGTAMIVGDSGMYSGAPAFVAALQTAGWRVVQTAYPGIGLTTPGESMRQSWADNARRYHVDLTIVMLGGWDVGWEQAHGAGAYRSAINETVAAFTGAGGKVLWLSILPGGLTDDRYLDRFYAALPARYPGTVDYLDIQSALRAPTGGWPRVVNGHALRGRDGWHLCQDGAAAVTHLALARVGLDRPGWDAAPWRNDPRYEPGTDTCTP